jgi:hypothetical protein
MNRVEIIDILTAVQVVDHRTVGEGDILMWGAIIGDLSKDDALQAVLDHRREQPGVWLEPGHIYERVRAIRQDRFQRQPLTDIEAHNDRTDERLAPLILELAEANSVNQVLTYRRPKHNPLTVACTYCHASIGHHCTSGGHTMRRYHDSRVEAASPPQPSEDAAWPICTACHTRPLVTDDDRARGVCTPCQQASTPQPETEVPEKNSENRALPKVSDGPADHPGRRRRHRPG